MRKIVKYLFFIVAIHSAQFAFAQTNVTFTRDNFYDNAEQLNEALRKIHAGDQYYTQAEKRCPSLLNTDATAEALYAAALPFFLEANSFNPNNADLNRRIAKCYLFAQREKALPYIQKAMSLNEEKHPELYLLQAIVYQSLLQFDNAVESYRQYKNYLLPSSYVREGLLLEKRIAECNTAKKFIANPQYVFVDNVKSPVNTTGPEFGLILSQDETQIFYNQGNLETGDSKWKYNVISTTKKGVSFDEPVALNFPYKAYNLLYLSEDGNYGLFYNPDKRKGEIYESFKKDDSSWSKPKSVSKNINHRKWDERSAFLSFDGNIFFFSSNRPGGYGGFDIYYAMKEYNGKWGKPINIGAAINSEYDDLILYVPPSGDMLYFASKGHESIGGFDIFQAALENQQWGDVQNLGYPINTPDDEISFYPAKNNKRFYISSNRNKGQGNFDIYCITLINPNKTVISNYEDNLLAYHMHHVSEVVIESAVTITSGAEFVSLNGLVTNEQKIPVKAVVSIVNTHTGQEVAQFESNAATGQFALPLAVGANYAMLVTARDYMFYSQNINVPHSIKSKVINTYVELVKMGVDKSVALRNIFFDYGKAILTEASIKELNMLYQMLIDKPNMKIEISGHTDNRGTEQVNKILSERRAKAVVDFLIRNGINPARLSYVGYGYGQPIAPNTTPEGRRQNRRTEFKIISQ